MRLEIDIAEHHYNNIMALDSVSLGRVPYKGIIMYSINAIKHGKVLEQEPTTKNDLGVSVERINKLANFAIEATGQSDSYCQGMCNGIEYMRASLTHTEPNYLDINEKVTPQLSVPEVTALAEWTEKLTKASEDAYHKGYTDCLKAQADLKRLRMEEQELKSRLHSMDIEEAYKKGYADGMKEQEPRKGHWIADVDRWGDVVTTVNGYKCDKCNAFNSDKDNFCPNCGADMREIEV